MKIHYSMEKKSAYYYAHDIIRFVNDIISINTIIILACTYCLFAFVAIIVQFFYA